MPEGQTEASEFPEVDIDEEIDTLASIRDSPVPESKPATDRKRIAKSRSSRKLTRGRKISNSSVNAHNKEIRRLKVILLSHIRECEAVWNPSDPQFRTLSRKRFFDCLALRMQNETKIPLTGTALFLWWRTLKVLVARVEKRPTSFDGDFPFKKELEFYTPLRSLLQKRFGFKRKGRKSDGDAATDSMISNEEVAGQEEANGIDDEVDDVDDFTGYADDEIHYLGTRIKQSSMELGREFFAADKDQTPFVLRCPKNLASESIFGMVNSEPMMEEIHEPTPFHSPILSRDRVEPTPPSSRPESESSLPPGATPWKVDVDFIAAEAERALRGLYETKNSKAVLEAKRNILQTIWSHMT